jgi:hypothetical protein
MVVFNDMDPRYPLQVHEKGVDWSQFSDPTPGSSIKVRSGDVHTPFIEPAEPLKKECEELLRCIRESDRHGGLSHPPRSSGRQGYANVRILASADESLAAGGAQVAVEAGALAAG